jgi:rhamnogalacturonan endolyase
MHKYIGLLLGLASVAFGNVPGGGSTGGDVKLTDNGTVVTMDNGVVALTVTKASGTITSLTYNGANVLSGGNNGGQFYWSWNMPNYQNPANCTYTLKADPAKDSGNRAEIVLHMAWNKDTATAAMDVDIHYILLRGSTGFYAAAQLSHPASYPDNPGGEWRMAGYVGSTFDWLSVDSLRNLKMCAPADWNAGTQPSDAPKEVHLLNQGIYAGQYECKYSYSADLGRTDAWGWSSTAKNEGIWVTVPSREFYNGGPLKRELTAHTGPTLLNMLGGQHYGMGNQMDMPAGQEVHKVYGPFFVYVNKVASGTANANTALWKDAVTQAKTEQSAWPYAWFNDTGYKQASQRGTVNGTIAISDWGNAAASPESLWVGLAPAGTDFQMQSMTYQFWTKTVKSGAFTIPNVLPGTYTLYAFGPGAIGTFSKAGVVVKAGQNPSLSETWIPDRKGATAWEIGIPNRTAEEFLHGNDYFKWGVFKQFPTEFPNGLTYMVGKSDWHTGWNFAQPTITSYDTAGNASYVQYPWKIDFDQATATTGATDSASLYLSFAAEFSAALIVTVNGTNVSSPTTGFYLANQSDAMIRLGSHGAWSDLRVTFPVKLLKAGTNEIVLNQRKGAYGASVMYDYLRLEVPKSTSTGISTTVHRHALLQRGNLLTGDGLHPLRLFSLSGHLEREVPADQSLSLTDLPHGTWLARCGAQALSVVSTTR